MITEFKIENYKSIENLSIKLGRVNVFIGENGSGKSNILEAFALSSAATQDKLDNEYLSARGIRVTKPQLMRAAFETKNIDLPIKFGFRIDNKDNFGQNLFNNNELYSKWYIILDKENVDKIEYFKLNKISIFENFLR